MQSNRDYTGTLTIVFQSPVLIPVLTTYVVLLQMLSFSKILFILPKKSITHVQYQLIFHMDSLNKLTKGVCTNKTSTANLIFMSFNVKGQQKEQKRKEQYQLMRDYKADVIFFQETHSEKTTEIVWKNQWGGESIFSHGDTNSRGVSIHFKPTLKTNILEKFTSEDGRFIWVKVEIHGEIFGLLNLYAPITEKENK